MEERKDSSRSKLLCTGIRTCIRTRVLLSLLWKISLCMEFVGCTLRCSTDDKGLLFHCEWVDSYSCNLGKTWLIKKFWFILRKREKKKVLLLKCWKCEWKMLKKKFAKLTEMVFLLKMIWFLCAFFLWVFFLWIFSCFYAESSDYNLLVILIDSLMHFWIHNSIFNCCKFDFTLKLYCSIFWRFLWALRLLENF